MPFKDCEERQQRRFWSLCIYSKVTGKSNCVCFVYAPDDSEDSIQSGHVIRFPSLLNHRWTFLLERLSGRSISNTRNSQGTVAVTSTVKPNEG